MNNAVLSRTTFETPRASEYFSARELQAQTGQPISQFAAVVLKELADNALDAAETAGAPPIISIEVSTEDQRIRIRVRDAGPGLPAATLRRILNFNTRTSDKSHYRSPTRGAQGNALKTVLGIPHALGSTDPVVIEARGIRHVVRAWTDPAGELRIDHDETPCRRTRGTAVEVVVPADRQDLDPVRWARTFSLVNPHTTAKIRVLRSGDKHAESDATEIRDSYHASVEPGGKWRKYGPSDATAPAWYDGPALERLVFAHIADARRGGGDPTLREFVRQFRGLAGSAKAKGVVDQFPEIERLSDFEAHPGRVAELLRAMQEAARAPSPSTLGLAGETHLLGRLDEWYGVKRHWYRKVLSEVDGIPFAFEVIVAETETSGHLFHALNFSPTFDDPFSGNRLPGGEEVVANSTTDFLHSAHASTTPTIHGWGGDHGSRVTAAVHLVCPALEFLDRGKSRVRLPPEMGEAIGQTLWRATSTLYREGERRERDAARAERRAQQRWRETTKCEEWTLKEAVFECMEEAVRHATGDGVYPVSAKNLHYAIRPLIQDYTDRTLDYTYFAQTLLPEYQRIHGALPNLYYDARGVLYEPHTGREIPLGTREVESYQFPPWTFDKILYVEKKGFWPILKTAALAERYDMAVIAAEGYANVAARSLLAAAEASDQKYHLFVLHDADPAGYEIARTLGEETRRMPEHQVEVTDLGLTVQDALDLGLEAEEFTRRKALPRTLKLNPTEMEFFMGREVGRRTWNARRIELNAFTAPGLIAYIERKLEEAGAVHKIIPPHDVLRSHAHLRLRGWIQSEVEREIERLVDPGAITDQLWHELRGSVDLSPAREWVERWHKISPEDGWEKGLGNGVTLAASPHREAVAERVRRTLAEIAEDEQGGGGR